MCFNVVKSRPANALLGLFKQVAHVYRGCRMKHRSVCTVMHRCRCPTTFIPIACTMDNYIFY